MFKKIILTTLLSLSLHPLKSFSLEAISDEGTVAGPFKSRISLEYRFLKKDESSQLVLFGECSGGVYSIRDTKTGVESQCEQNYWTMILPVDSKKCNHIRLEVFASNEHFFQDNYLDHLDPNF